MNDDKNPSPGEPAGQEPTEQFGQVGDSSGKGSAGQPGAAGEAARPGQAVPPAERTSQLDQPAPAVEQTGQQAGPAAQQPNPPGHFAQPGPWGMPLPPPKQSGFRRFVAHRATQLVAVGVLGLAVGGGIVGGVMAATHHPGMSQHQGGHRFNDGGPGQRHRVPDGQNGGNQNNGPGFGNGGGTSSGTGN
ncbi:hypothetical protein [Amycolatopsis rubida]|uniref:Uncharacterized protein n=1 Tax=Amycolatopsis rubida TaxID=112413 RepID=A0A1I5ELJ6_9PSEU|nr:hypothetical protein [Amycolatopsis rubida]SFO12392.1 hypothetical protein SAMN05421854_101701 [Amycolatopsis rubida]